MSNSIIQKKTRVKSLATSDVKKKFINNKWRRICSVENCERQSQRRGLCARHLSGRKNPQQLLENSEVLYHNATDSFLLNNNLITQNISNQSKNASSTTIHTSQIESTIIPCSTSEHTQYSGKYIAYAYTTDNNRSSITIAPSGKYISAFSFQQEIL
ncbi:unnamed protein product [Adineta steineri]|uniref:Uncharacterized protein n=1 Tax=Adineta steineri TaxID=433720 RepID=A0A819K371_9BILA|nr:unnamed protein product [Adineta steineri]